MIRAVGRVSGWELPYHAGPRRTGDPAEVVACVDEISARLGWTARFGLDDIVASASASASAVVPATGAAVVPAAA
jgi:UDP-glucose 4-epimerase